jgi:hypothetical protein
VTPLVIPADAPGSRGVAPNRSYLAKAVTGLAMKAADGRRMR